MKRFLKVLARILAIACFLMAIALLVLTVAGTSSTIITSYGLAPVILQVTSLLPQSLAHIWDIASPLGGVFRCDFTLVALVLIVAGKVLRRLGRR